MTSALLRDTFLLPNFAKKQNRLLRSLPSSIALLLALLTDAFLLYNIDLSYDISNADHIDVYFYSQSRTPMRQTFTSLTLEVALGICKNSDSQIILLVHLEITHNVSKVFLNKKEFVNLE